MPHLTVSFFAFMFAPTSRQTLPPSHKTLAFPCSFCIMHTNICASLKCFKGYYWSTKVFPTQFRLRLSAGPAHLNLKVVNTRVISLPPCIFLWRSLLLSLYQLDSAEKLYKIVLCDKNPTPPTSIWLTLEGGRGP